MAQRKAPLRPAFSPKQVKDPNWDHPTRLSKRKIIDETHADEGHRSRAKKQISKKTSDHGQVHPRGANTHVVETAVAVYVFGDGENAELGLGPKRTESLIPRRNPFLDPTDPSKFHVIQVACGGMHTVALTVDNKIITWGVNDNGALGRPTEWDGGLRDIDIDSDDEEEELNPLESTPSQVLTVSFGRHTQFIQVAAGDNCTFALSSEGEVYGWGTFRDHKGNQRFGYNSGGEPIEKQPTPSSIRGLHDIIQIACGANHILVLDKDGNVWGWGSNDENQLGHKFTGRNQDTYIPRKLRICRAKVVYIASGEFHSFAVDERGEVWAWGRNSNFECACQTDTGLPAYPAKIRELSGTNVTVLSGGANHSTAATSDGQCFAWGRMDTGQLGIPFTTEQLHNYRLIRRGIQGKPQICTKPVLVPNIGCVTNVACGSDHTLFVNADGQTYVTGYGFNGQLGLKSRDDVTVAQRLIGGALKDKAVSWAGAGGRFSVVTQVAK